jgi:hypothetical protein
VIARRPEVRKAADIIQDNGVSWQDDIETSRKRPSWKLKVFSLIGALVFALLGAGLYAVSGWPWQGTTPAVAVSTQQPEVVRPPPAPLPSAPAALTASAAPSVLQAPAATANSLPQPSPVTPAPAPPPVAVQAAAPQPTAEQLAEARPLVQRAIGILQQTSDIAAARLFLDRAAKLGDAEAAFRLAETYDPAWLARSGARGVSGDVSRARLLYQQALDRGMSAASERIAALK